uniref:NADH-ubiquinone oxidoreductase chain 4 n=1 Tax=Pseudogarypus banksi TaxID=1131925 RepID=H9MFJ2_9ARAC|nr:NADH dehydrogenase subunit 4 [Pseudogarypus banksi]
MMMLLFLGFIFSCLNLFILISIMLLFFLLFMLKYYWSINEFMNFCMIDNVSCYLIMLTLWVVILVLLKGLDLKCFLNLMNYNYYMMIFILGFILMVCFLLKNFFIFYLFFELALVPLFMLIYFWGYYPERMSAGVYMMLYTIFSSLPLLVTLIIVWKISASLTIWMMKFYTPLNYNKLMLIFLLFSFLIKSPMFYFHLWLPKAHTQAPVFGSMILAGVVLKLGGYGLIRVLFLVDWSLLMEIFLILGLLGALWGGMVSLCQKDFKMLIAYSSISHMGMVIYGVLGAYKISVLGSLMMMVAHGLCSSGLFFILDLLYTRVFTRSVLLLKGSLILFVGGLMFYWFMLIIGNFSSPPSLGLLSEILILVSIFSYNLKMILVIFLLLMMLVAWYSLFLFIFNFHGDICLMNGLIIISMVDYINLFCHLLPLNLLILKMGVFY